MAKNSYIGVLAVVVMGRAVRFWHDLAVPKRGSLSFWSHKDHKVFDTCRRAMKGYSDLTDLGSMACLASSMP